MHIDVEKTKKYYAAPAARQLCDCAYCVNFRAEVKATYPALAAYLATLGVDIAKPLETSPLEVESDRTIVYCLCQYVVFGSCEEDFRREVGGVALARGSSYPATGIQEEHFVLDAFSLRLPWRMENSTEGFRN